MDDQREARLVELFRQASSLRGAERDAYLRRIREEDPGFAQSVADLLAAASELDDLLRSPEGDRPATSRREGDPDRGLLEFTKETLQRLVQRTRPITRYRFEGEVARGGQGAILRVWDEDLRRTLAMKVVLGRGDAPTGETPRVDPRTLGRFLEEAQVTGQLDHPGIVPVHELGLDSEGQVYFTMKLVKGRDLKAIFDLVHEGKEGWTLTRALNVMLKVCEAMAYAHSKGVIHRDLKPSNVMVGKFGEVYVMDWGLARVIGQEDGKDIRIQPGITTSEMRSGKREDAGKTRDSLLMTMDGDVVGTPAYMSPEQALGEVEAMGPQSDVYAVGAMFYHLLASHLPYLRPGRALSNHDIWQKVRKGPPHPLPREAPAAPSELVAICEKAMERAPELRYASMEALADDLRSFLEGRVVRAYETGAWAEARKWVRRNRALALSLGSAVALLVTGLVSTLVLRKQAVVSAEEAKKQEGIAKACELVALQRAEDILSLSAFQVLEDLEKQADALWPPHPRHLQAYDEWLAAAAKLVAGLEPDARTGDTGHRARLAALREKALPWTEAELEAARRAHPRFGEIEPLRREIAAMREAQDVREGKATATEPELDADLPEDADGLLDLARPLIDPQRSRHGDELLGLALARLALERVEDDAALARANETLAWALFATGQDARASEEMELAASLAPEELRSGLEDAQKRLHAAIEGMAPEKGRAAIAEEESRLARLEEIVSENPGWRFADERDRWWHAQLVKLVGAIEAFADPETGLWKGSSPEHGWGIERRRAFASTVAERTIAGTEAQAPWAAAAERVAANPRYGQLVLSPQLGLVPIGPDPDSGLEEFGHPLTGSVPVREATGEIVPSEEMGLVFVLLPGGTFVKGAQSSEPSWPNYDPAAQGHEGPTRRVTVSPFFLSKYEMTQGQWLRFTGRNPSWSDPDQYNRTWNAAGLPGDLTHPVEQVNWYECDLALTRMGLVLPTETQWEYGARAGTTTPWWTGREKKSLAGAANLADRYARDHGGGAWGSIHELWLEDGNTSHARVGSFAPNPFGLHDVHGNVAEWCGDAITVDGVRSRMDTGSSSRVVRGGSFDYPASRARSSTRDHPPPENAANTVGLRPARSLGPP